jgi:hypothetical protein
MGQRQGRLYVVGCPNMVAAGQRQLRPRGQDERLVVGVADLLL